MKIKYPKSAFTSIIEEAGICLVLNKRLYIISSVNSVEDKRDFFYLSNKEYHLNPSESIDFIEYTYFKNNKYFISTKLEEITDDYLQTENKNLEREIQKLKKDYFLVDFIVNKVFPIHFKDRNQKSTVNSSIKKKNKNNENNSFKNSFDLILNRNYSIIEKDIIKGNNLLIINGYVYKIKKIPKIIAKKADNEFRINNSYYNYSFVEPLSNLEINYQKKISDEIKKFSNYNKNLLEDQARLVGDKKNLKSILSKSEYKIEDIGFSKVPQTNGGGYYVFIEQKPFVLKALDSNDYYKFDKCRVAVQIKLKNNKVDIENHPIVMEEYYHPLIDISTKKYQRICFSGHKERFLAKITGDHYKRNNLSEVVYAILTKAGQKQLKEGYVPGARVFHHLDRSSFNKNLISTNEAGKYNVENSW